MTTPTKASRPPRRKGATRIADIPRDILVALNEGRDETITLVEWLAIDQSVLLGHVLPALGFRREQSSALVAGARASAAEGVTVRTKRLGARIWEMLAQEASRRREQLFEGLATHRSDMIRAFAAYSLAADPGLDLQDRLGRARRFAADRSMAVRECAWDSFRPWLARELPRGLKLLVLWARDRDPNIRRCATEATRPQGVWNEHLEALKQDPSPGLPLLHACRSDPSDYVRRSVANWLNDARKSRPDWVAQVCARWTRTSDTKETAWIVRHALRSVRRAG